MKKVILFNVMKFGRANAIDKKFAKLGIKLAPHSLKRSEIQGRHVMGKLSYIELPGKVKKIGGLDKRRY